MPEPFWRTCRWCGHQIASGKNIGGDDGVWYSKTEITTGGIAKHCFHRGLMTGDTLTALHQPYDLKPAEMPLEEWLDV